MEKEDLIKKLESIELPDIKIESHKKGLKMALLSSDYFKKPSFFEVFRKSLVFSVPALVVLIIFSITIIQPKFIEAKAIGIVKNNPEVKKLMEENNMVLSEVKVKNGKAYVLVNIQKESKVANEKPSAITIQKVKENEKNDIEGAIVEVNLNQNKVNKINPIRSDDIAPLANEEKELAREIVESEEIVEEIIPKEAKIEKIQSSLPQKIHLVEENQEFKAIHNPEEDGKEARVHYTLDGKKWIIKVNLKDKRVEEIKYSPENKNP